MLQKCDANAAHIFDYFYCLFNVVDAFAVLRPDDSGYF